MWKTKKPHSTCFKVEEIEQKINLVGGHLNSVFLEEDEAKPVENSTDSFRVFLGPKQVKTRATLDIPLAIPPLDLYAFFSAGAAPSYAA